MMKKQGKLKILNYIILFLHIRLEKSNLQLKKLIEHFVEILTLS